MNVQSGGSMSNDMVTVSSFVGGERIPGDVEPVLLRDPSTGETWASASSSTDCVDQAVASARKAFMSSEWGGLSAAARAGLVRLFGRVLRENAEELGRYESLANGKPHSTTIPEMRGTADWYDYFATLAENAEDRITEISASAEARIRREPLGVVGAITPFNAALALGSWKIAPALAAGNTVVVKPPVEASISTVRFAELAVAAGLPKGVLNVIVGSGAIGEKLVLHPDVAMVSFTGSTAVSKHLGALCGGQMKRFVCEAGGKSAHIVFDDADIDSAVIAATQGVFSAAGQTCVAGSRLLVHSRVHDAFLEKYQASVSRLRVGDPFQAGTHVGPVAAKRHLDRIRGFVERATGEGAKVTVGGSSPDMPGRLAGGFWFSPTVLTGTNPSMEVCREEVFGPVVAVQSFEEEDEVVAIANGTDYGLAAGFWTRDAGRIRRLGHRLMAGTVWVNTYRTMSRKVPFGGYKQSGIGRENGPEALDEFTQVKSIVTDYAPAVDSFAR